MFRKNINITKTLTVFMLKGRLLMMSENPCYDRKINQLNILHQTKQENMEMSFRLSSNIYESVKRFEVMGNILKALRLFTAKQYS